MPETLLIERGPLLNFWVAEIVLPHPHRPGTRTYKGVEWRFQAMKSTCYVRVDDAEATHDIIASAPDGFSAKRLGRNLPINVPAWDARAYWVMLEALMTKFSQHADLRDLLVETGDQLLVEHRPDPIWGDAMDGSGRNLQGRALTTIRALLR